jgi:hypothetical protein
MGQLCLRVSYNPLLSSINIELIFLLAPKPCPGLYHPPLNQLLLTTFASLLAGTAPSI